MAYDGKGEGQSYGSSPVGSSSPSPPMDRENKEALEQAADRMKQQHRQPVGDALSKWLIKISQDIESIDRQKRLRKVRQMIKTQQYFDGNFFGYIDSNLDWVEVDRGPEEIWYTDNQLYPYLRTALMELSRTQTQVVIEAAIDDDEELDAAAKFAQQRYDINRARTFNALLKQTENGYALLCGITFRYTFPQFTENDSDARQEKMPVIQKRAKGGDETEGEDKTKICAVCLKPKRDLPDIGQGTQEPDKCLHCGSDMFGEYGGDEDRGAETVIGYEDIPHCKNTWIVPNPASITVSMSAATIEESKFLKWKQMVLRCVLQERYTGIELPSTGVKSQELRYIHNQQRTAVNSQQPNGRTGLYYDDSGAVSVEQASVTDTELEELEFHQVWLDYEVICNKKFDEDQPLGNGEVLKAGKPLGSKYHRGLWYATCEQMVVDMFNECKNSKWTSSPYGLRSGSMYGSGSFNANSQQDLVNDIRRLVMANAWSNGVPREFINDEVISELSVDPQIPTKFSLEAGMGSVIGFGYAQAPAVSLSADIYALSDITKGDIQNTIGSMSGTGAGGLADSQKWGDTATAISIKRDLAVGRFSPDLELMADRLDRQQAFQFLENEQKFNTPQDWKRYKATHNEAGVERFKQLDIREDLVITITPGSWMPKSEAQMQSKMMAFSQILPIIIQTQNPELIAYASEVFGMPEFLGGWATERASTNRLIQRFKALADMYIQQFGDVPDNSLEPVPDPSGQMDPQTGQPAMMPSQAHQAAEMVDKHAGMPVDIFLDNHTAIQDVLKDWRATDEGQNASNLLLATVAMRYMKHQEGVARQQQIMAATSQAGTEPLQREQEAAQADAAQAAREQEQKGTQMQVAGAMVAANNQEEDSETKLKLEQMKLDGKAAERDSAERMHQNELDHKEKIKDKELAVAAKAASASGKK